MTLSKEFYRNIETIATKAKHTSSTKQVFQDVIQVAFNSIIGSQYFHPYKLEFHPSLFRELTEYKDQPELWDKLGQTVHLWLEAIKSSGPFSDVMGSAYDEHLGQQLGQFLTPPDLAQLTATITLAAAKESIEDDLKNGEPVVVGDITGCGAGSLLLAWLSAFTAQHGFRNLLAVAVEGQDLDRTMVQLTAVQIFFGATFHGMPLGGIRIRWGNALTEPDATVGFQAVFSPEKLLQAHAAVEASKAFQRQVRALTALTLKVAPMH